MMRSLRCLLAAAVMAQIFGAPTQGVAQELPAGHPPIDGPVGQPLPPGHPAVDDTSTQDMPPGHPPVDAPRPRARPSSARAGADVFDPPEDTEAQDPTLAPGTIAVELRDGDDHPLADEAITLGILINSIAKGDTRRHLQAVTDAHGLAMFSGLETESNVAYRVTSAYQGGSFAALPFQMSQGKAMRVVLHVYPVTHDIQSTLILCEAVVAAELRDDRIQLEEVFTLYNLGRTAWQPTEVTMALPHGFTAFSAQQSMSDQGVDALDTGARLRGTFPPGHHAVEFRWQLPWAEDKDVDLSVGMPPHVAIARVLMPATAGIKLSANGFPPAEVRRDSQGQSFLVTERRVRPDEPKVVSLEIGIHDLPTPGPGRDVATALAAFGVALGLALVARKRSTADASLEPLATRRALLVELGALEDARSASDVGPRTYENARREILDSIALTVVK